jgi:hypothetical protein
MQSSTGLAVTGLSSHVLFSACSADEPASEGGGKGRFTTALLKVFNKTSPDQLTYEQVLDRLEHIPLCVRMRCTCTHWSNFDSLAKTRSLKERIDIASSSTLRQLLPLVLATRFTAIPSVDSF